MKNELVNKLNQNIADLHIVYVKLHNYHWNIQGNQFFSIHNATEEYYNHIADLYDEIAERVLQLDAKPVATVKEYLNSAKIKEDVRNVFSPAEVLSVVISDFSYLLGEYKSILELAEKQNDVGTANIISEIIGWLEKTLWMLNASKEN